MLDMQFVSLGKKDAKNLVGKGWAKNHQVINSKVSEYSFYNHLKKLNLMTFSTGQELL